MISLRAALVRYKLVVTLIASAVLCASGSSDAAQNLALSKPYLCTGELLAGWTGLVDGLKDSDQPPACFATDNSPQFPKELVIDLAAVFPITKIAVYNSLNGNTRHIAILSSLNATDFESLREYYFPPDKVQPLIHSFPAHPRRARYIKIKMYDTWTGGRNGDYCLYLREVEVYGTPEGSASTPDSLTEVMALARWQQPLVEPPTVALFRRYCLEAKSQIAIGLLGDGFAAAGNELSPTWVDLFTARLKERGEYWNIELTNLAGQPGLSNLPQLHQALASLTSVDLLIIAYGTQAGLDGMPTLEFRRRLHELVDSTQEQLTVLTVVVTPAPFANQPDLARHAEVQGKDSLRLARAAEQVATLTGCALVRTASVLARSERDVQELYQDNVSLSQPAHLALSRAMEELLW